MSAYENFGGMRGSIADAFLRSGLPAFKPDGTPSQHSIHIATSEGWGLLGAQGRHYE